ncbi:low temperature requirement protein A [Micromonospora purpureochromogenes]|uniref:Low temperature requirement protein LtrA n=1 Tax=Micromonospora purpureochromogenes TaxID=47872 RepID=A0ABX2RG83_9ACTN|nr:low temperature requirement protein A [Micromonospora purpureochromogenes]NYF54223.1 low temperature requirement protein LtrA [Micromonospora purpureochromogenes]
MGTSVRNRLVSWGGPGTRVTRLELFYDLVFVFAFLNVTTLAAADLTARRLVEAMFVLALLWWCWTGFAAVGNMLRADRGVMPLVGFSTMAAVFVLALTTAVAFRDEPGGLYGPWVFSLAYLATWVVRVVALWSTVGRGRAPQARSMLLTARTMGGAVIIVIAASVPQRVVPDSAVEDVRLGLWAFALLVEYAGGLVLPRTGWRLRSVGHWAERHALIVLVALGESVIALGISSTSRAGRPIGIPVIAAAVFGIAIIAALWWLYFDVLAFAVEQVLHGVRGHTRIPMARDVYTYLHLPLIVGIILFALGLKEVMAGVIQDPSSASREELGGLVLLVLYGGVILYLVALVAIQLRVFRRLDRVLTAAAVLLVLLFPAAYRLPVLTTLSLLTAAVVVVVLVQLWATREVRGRVRETALDEQAALEAEANSWRRRHF